ncbi:MAG: hypothetical protein Rhims3KO_35920 [Hyphomicrobiales bacterium]
MIYVFQDEAKIPAAWLAKVAALQEQLEALPDLDARKDFIDANSAVWGEIKAHLLEMSSGKCWYSEAPDAVSDWHVDHFRPKKRALDPDKTEHEGYPWLAFDWKNYRIAGSYSNSPHKDGEGVARGKWDFFPLAPGCARANWTNRDCGPEICLLLDPTKPEDPKQITFDERGIPIPSAPEIPVVKKKVETTVYFLHLDHERLVQARKQKWREVTDWIEEFRAACPENIDQCTKADYERTSRLLQKVSKLTAPNSPYAATARACLEANGLAPLVHKPEENTIAA